MTSNFESRIQTPPIKSYVIDEGKAGAILVRYKNGDAAVVKLAIPNTPKLHQRFIHGFKTETLPKREVAFYALAKHLGWEDLVPETVMSEYKGVPASFQKFTFARKLRDLDPRFKDQDQEDSWSRLFVEVAQGFPDEDFARLTLLDFLACARDRHGNNYGARLGLSPDKKTTTMRLVGWDNAATFGPALRRYHCIAHKYLYAKSFPLEPYQDKLERLTQAGLWTALGKWLSAREVFNVWLRAQFALAYPYRMPWVTLSQGSDSPETFPPYADFFNEACGDPRDSRGLFVLHQSEISG